jgi:hypothetical protein
VREYINPDDFIRANKNGIPAQCVKQRFSSGWSKERTLTQKYRPKCNLWEKHKEESLVRKETFKSRIFRGWTPEEAATTPAGPAGNRRRK